MLRRTRWFGVLLLAGAAALPAPAVADMPADQACDQAGTAAEQREMLPAGLLVSIGIVESGRVTFADGQRHAWPWTVDVDGTGHFFTKEADAAAFTRLAQASGASDIDVGCFQVSLLYHPLAFASLDAAFDPTANAGFAAAYLRQLRAQTGSWDGAIADYHSAAPAIGLPYQRRVLAAWHGRGAVSGGILPMFLAPDPVVIRQSSAARLVRVITADDMTARNGWPLVIVP